MKVNENSDGSVVVLGVGQRLTLGDDFDELECQVERQLRRGRRAFLLDLEHTTRIDAAGLGELVRLLSRVQAQGGRLDLLHLRRSLLKLLDLVELGPIFRVFETESDAFRSLKAASARPSSMGRSAHPSEAP